MKKRPDSYVNATALRIALLAILFSSLALLALVAGPSNGERTLSFGERVKYQRAIEQVYWSHRIWPETNKKPKPPLDELISQSEIEHQVRTYLSQSQELESSNPITPEQLQAEMDRMAQRTRQPEVLREVFAALDNDPAVVAECLVRPILSARLSKIVAQSKPVLVALARKQRMGRERIAKPRYVLPKISFSTGSCLDNWADTSVITPDGRVYHTAVWTGSEMIIWGGYANGGDLGTGGRYNPTTDSWTLTNMLNAPEARESHTAVWTGTTMIIWGGYSNSSSSYLPSGGRYNPATDTWLSTSQFNAPAGRYYHTAVWTGSQMIVWGGYGD